MTQPDPTPARKVNHAALAAGLAAGIAFGLLATATGSSALTSLATGVRPLGTLFVNAIQMVVIPLVVCVIFVGIARLGDLCKAGRLGGSSILFFWLTTVPAILIGMGLMVFALRFSPEVATPAVQDSAAREFPGLLEFLVTLVPRNPFQAAANGTLLPLAASLNRAGSALFQGAVVVFLASLYDVPLPAAAMAAALFATFLASMTVAPVPSSSIVSLVPTLDTVGVPQAGLAILLGVDRIPDMFRSATNVLGHMTAASVVDRVSAKKASRQP